MVSELMKMTLNHYALITISVLAVFLNGCNPLNYIRTFPLYSEIKIEHPEFINEVGHEKDYRGWSPGFLTPEMEPIRERVNVYLNQHPEVPSSIKSSLQELRVEKGMSQEQVLLIMGEPSGKINGVYEGTNKSYETWIYGTLSLRSVTFNDGILHTSLDLYRYSSAIVKKRIESYCEKYPNLSLDLKTDLCNAIVKKGMNTEQVVVLLGEPTHKKRLKETEELWVYSDRVEKDEIQWYYKWGKLRFREDILFDIERQMLEFTKGSW